MTNLKEVNFGINQYCGPAMLSILTGESTDRCAAVISSVSGKREIKAVERGHLKESLKRLKFDVKDTVFSGSTLYGTLFRMHTYDGLYVVFVKGHVVVVEVKDNEIYICDNHTKIPIDIKQSARLTQKVEQTWQVFPHPIPKLIRSEIKLRQDDFLNRINISRIDEYDDIEDNSETIIGYIRYKDKLELRQIMYVIQEEYKI